MIKKKARAFLIATFQLMYFSAFVSDPENYMFLSRGKVGYKIITFHLNNINQGKIIHNDSYIIFVSKRNF